MNAVATPAAVRRGNTASVALNAAVRFWFVVLVAGQFLFAWYILAFYGGAAAHGDPDTWNDVLPAGYVAGRTIGNLVIGAHLLFAAIVTIGGPLQLIPQIRAHAPVFHRWNGRLYLTTAVIAAVTGLYLVAAGRAVGNFGQHLAISVNAVLILACATMALRHAIARDFATHRRWALRLFLVVSGVWFFRVGLMFWIAVNGGPAGFDPETFEGPALVFIGVCQYLLPLALLECYLRVRAQGGVAARYAMTASLLVLTLAMAAGIAVAAKVLWLPHIGAIA